jgi:hypothetical protein
MQSLCRQCEMHIEGHMFLCKCDMYLILGAFPDNAVQYAHLKNQVLLGIVLKQLYTAVCGSHAYGNGTSKQTFLLGCYSICETTADG